MELEVSLTVLKIRLIEANESSAPSSGGDATANQTLTPSQRVFCELQVTGRAEDRGLVAPTAQTTNRAPSRRKHSSRDYSYEPPDAPSSLSRTLAQWSFSPDEMHLPVDYSAALRFRYKPGIKMPWLANFARSTVSKVFEERRVDAFERFAAGANWLPTGNPTLPTTMIRQLHSLLLSVIREGDSLWLELAEPVGYLPLLPWEEMLRPVTTVPILRLSPHAVQPLPAARKLSVVLFLTAPSEKWIPAMEQLASLAGAIRASIPEGSTMHVFADDLCREPFAKAINQIGSDETRRLELYSSPPQISDENRDPWMTWMAESLRGCAVDIVHVLAPGQLFADQARLVIAREPVSGPEPAEVGQKVAGVTGRTLRYVTALEICDCLTLLGAWGAVFSTPLQSSWLGIGTWRDAFSIPEQGSWLVNRGMGLRLLVDQIGRLRPGVLVFHDAKVDAECKALAETYQFITGDASTTATKNPSISLYCYPARTTAAAVAPASLPDELMQRYIKVKEAIQSAIEHGGPAPAWLAATERLVEDAVSRAADNAAANPDSPAIRGLASALEYVEQMLANSP